MLYLVFVLFIFRIRIHYLYHYYYYYRLQGTESEQKLNLKFRIDLFNYRSIFQNTASQFTTNWIDYNYHNKRRKMYCWRNNNNRQIEKRSEINTSQFDIRNMKEITEVKNRNLSKTNSSHLDMNMNWNKNETKSTMLQFSLNLRRTCVLFATSQKWIWNGFFLSSYYGAHVFQS